MSREMTERLPRMLSVRVLQVCPVRGIDMAECVLDTGFLRVGFVMLKEDYEELVRDGFFIRDGEPESRGEVLNTSRVYEAVRKQ